MSSVECVKLSKSFGAVRALAEVSLCAEAGEALLVLGPSGSGKTTLLRLIAGLERPDEGTVALSGRTATGAGTFMKPHQRGVAFVFQRPTFWGHLTALDNVALALGGRGLRRRERRARAAGALDALGMTARAGAWPGTLSGGELQRVALARALATEPRVLLLDEPFSGLDVELQKGLIEDLRPLKERARMTMIWVSHKYEEALALADGLLLLAEGKALEAGQAEAVLARPRSAFGARFLLDANLLMGRVTGEGRAWTALGEVECPRGIRTGEVTFALPPDAFAMSENGGLRAEVISAEFRGRYFSYTMRLGGERMRVFLERRLAVGEKVSLEIRRPPFWVEEA